MKKLLLLTLFFQLSFLQAGEGAPGKKRKVNTPEEIIQNIHSDTAALIAPKFELIKKDYFLVEQYYSTLFKEDEKKIISLFHKDIYPYCSNIYKYFYKTLISRDFPPRRDIAINQETPELKQLRESLQKYSKQYELPNIALYATTSPTDDYDYQRNAIYLSEDVTLKKSPRYQLGATLHKFCCSLESDQVKIIGAVVETILQNKHVTESITTRCSAISKALKHRADLKAVTLNQKAIKTYLEDSFLEAPKKYVKGYPSFRTRIELVSQLSQLLNHEEQVQIEAAREVGLITHEEADIARIVRASYTDPAVVSKILEEDL